MTSDVSDNEIAVLQALWQLKALGARATTLEQLATRLSRDPKTTREDAVRLEERGLIERRIDSGNELLKLTLLGVAFVRQMLDTRLSDLARPS